MGTLFLITILSCSQVQGILMRIQKVDYLTIDQKKEIIEELRSAVPTCPVFINKNDNKSK